MIELHEVTRVHMAGETEVRALRGVTATIEKGSFNFIVGPSGSGKSTLLHLLGALEERDAFALAVVSGGRIDGSTHRWARDDVPFAFLSSGLDVTEDSANSDRGFSESACAGSGLHLHSGAELGHMLLG